MSKYETLIERQLNILNEQEPVEGEPSPISSEPSMLPGVDDTSKLKVGYVEMIRKALIMEPKHIDSVDYAKLTKIVDTENLEEIETLVTRIIQNNYPHLDT